MPKFKRIIISYLSGEPRELMRKAGFTWKFSKPVPIADSVEFYCCERKKKGPLPDNFRSVGWSDERAFSYFTEEQIEVCKQWAAAPQQRHECWCCVCRPVTMHGARFVVCPDCGNKRCPRANDHRNKCSGSNEPGQEGSAYPAAPQQEAE